MSTSYHSNIDDVGAWLDRCIDGFSLNEDERGRDIAESIAEGIEVRSDQEQSGALDDWPKNSEPYRTRKLRKYGTDKTNYRTKQMLSRASLLGDVVVNKDSVDIRYGTGRPPDGSSGHVEKSDQQITDIEKARFAHQLGRPFFELDDEIADKAFEIFCDQFEDHIESS